MKLLAKREDLEGDIEINKKSQHSSRLFVAIFCYNTKI
ncbi:unnamed protein product [Arabidopsis halleri]